MKKFFPFLITLLLGLSPLYGQSAFEPGHVIKHDNDTLRGLIENTNPVKMGKICRFKTNEQAEIMEYTPHEIKVYRLQNGKFYVSKVIQRDDQEQKVFLQFLVDGIADLYYYKDEQGGHYYIQNEGSTLNELVNTEVSIQRQTSNQQGYQTFKRERKEYIGILKNSFSDCKEIFPRIDKLKLSHDRLIKITRDYHDYVCDEYECVTYEKDVKPTVSVGLVVGGQNTTTNFTVKNYDFDFIHESSFENTRNFSLNTLLSISQMFGINKKIRLNIAPGYASHTVKSEYVNIELGSINIPLFGSYKIIDGNFSPVINMGLVNSFWFVQAIDVDIATDHDLLLRVSEAERPERKENVETYREDMLHNSLGRYQLSLFIGGGLEYNAFQNMNYFIDFQYTLGTGINDHHHVNNYLASTTSSLGIYLGFKYQLNNY